MLSPVVVAIFTNVRSQKSEELSATFKYLLYYRHPGAVLLAGQAGAGGGRVCAVRAAQPHDAEGGHGAAAGDAGGPRLLQPRAAPRQAAPRHHPPGGAGRQVTLLIPYTMTSSPLEIAGKTG